MVLRGFGNTPINDEMFIPPGVTPPITDVTYAGTYPLRHYLTNPPITTPEFPSNPPRATNKAPVRAFAPYDRLTNTRATTAQFGSLRGMTTMGALPAGAYSGAVGRVIRRLDPDTGAGLRGQMLHTRLHGYDAPPAHLHGAHGAYLHGLGAMPDALELKQAIPQDVADVARFTIADPRTVKGQLVGTRLVLVGVKEGSTKVEVEDTSGTRSVIGLTVKGLLPAEQMAVAQETFNAIKSITGSRPDLRIDWQDADVLRANYDLIYPVLRRIRNAAVDTPGFRPQEFQSNFLINALEHARANPSLRTLRDVILNKWPGIAADPGFRNGTGGRECGRNSVTKVVFHDLYTFTRDYHAAGKITNVILTIADVVGKVWSTFDPATGKTISETSKAVRAVAAPALAEYGTDPKRLVSNFGNAVCVAIAGGPSAQPVATRAAATLRQQAIAAAAAYRTLGGSAGLSGFGAAPATAAEAREQGQAALAQLETLDAPGAFTPAENAQLAEARATLNAGTSLGPASGGSGSRNGAGGSTESKGIPGWVWGAGALAVIGGVLLFRKRGK